jgi:hypothetical protein
MRIFLFEDKGIVYRLSEAALPERSGNIQQVAYGKRSSTMQAVILAGGLGTRDGSREFQRERQFSDWPFQGA